MIGGLALPAGAGKEGVFMVKALVVVGKIPMPRPGSQKAAQGCPGEGQLWGKGVQWEGQVPVRWWCMLCPVSRKAAVQSLFKEASGPSKTDWGRGGMRIPWMCGPQVGLLVSHLIASDTGVAWDPVDKDLPRGHPRKVGASGGPAGGQVLELQEGLLAGAPWGAL